MNAQVQELALDAPPAQALTVAERATRAIAAPADVELKELVEKSASIVTITNPDGYKQCHATRMVLKNTRLDIDRKAKAAKEEAKSFVDAVDAEKRRLIELIEPEEERLEKLQKAWDQAREEERQAKIRTENERKAALQARVDALRNTGSTLSVGSGSDHIASAIYDLQRVEVGEDFEEFRAAAYAAKGASLERLQTLLESATAHEAEQAQIAEERAELERMRAEQAEREAEAKRQAAEVEAKQAAARKAQEALLIEVRALQEMPLAARRPGTLEGFHDVLAKARAYTVDAEKFGALAELAQTARDVAVSTIEADIQQFQQRIEQEARDRAERQRVAEEGRRQAEERARLEQQQREAAAAEKARQEAEEANRREADRLEAERVAAEEAERQRQAAAEREEQEAAAARKAEAERIERAKLHPPTSKEIVKVLADHYKLPHNVVVAWLACRAWSYNEAE